MQHIQRVVRRFFSRFSMWAHTWHLLRAFSFVVDGAGDGKWRSISLLGLEMFDDFLPGPYVLVGLLNLKSIA